MRRKYHSQASIVLDVLEVISNKAGVTKIMSEANLSYERLKEILNHLSEKGLVSSERSGDYLTYTITLKA